MREPQRPTELEMSVYMLGQIDGFRRLTRAINIGESMYEVWSEGKPHVYFSMDDADGVFDFDFSSTCIAQLHPDVVTKCETWLAWMANQDERRANSWPQSAREDCRSPLTTEHDHVTHVVFDDKTVQVGEEAAFIVDLRRILREEMEKTICAEMSNDRSQISDMVAAELAIQRGPHGKFREIVRRIVLEELADAIKDEMQEMRDAIDRLRMAYSQRKG